MTGAGGALIHVGRPDLEGSSGKFEGQADKQEDQGDLREARPLRGFAEARAGSQEVGGPRQTVYESDSIQEECGGKRSQQKIFQRGFVAKPVRPPVACQDVGRDGGNLQPQENHDEIGGGRHEAHPHRPHQNQGIELSVLGVVAFQIIHGAQNHQSRHEQEQIDEIEAEIVCGNSSAECGSHSRPRVERKPCRAAACGENSQQPHPAEQFLVGGADKWLQDHDQHREDGRE